MNEKQLVDSNFALSVGSSLFLVGEGSSYCQLATIKSIQIPLALTRKHGACDRKWLMSSHWTDRPGDRLPYTQCDRQYRECDCRE